MDDIVKFFLSVPDIVWDIIVLCTRVSAVLFVYFSTKYRNGKHNPLYYILAALFPIIGIIAFGVKRKEMNGVGMNKCPLCQSLYPPEFKMCYKCNIELPPYDEKKSGIFKKLAAVMLAVSIVLIIANISSTVAIGSQAFKDIIEGEDYSRISFADENGNIVYYDRNGAAYEDGLEVALYTKKGKKYVYSSALECYTSSDGKTVDYSYAFVDSDGYFVKKDNLTLNALSETDSDSILDYFSMPYYEIQYIDEEGNIYYPAVLASWTSDGELIVDDSYLYETK